MNIVNTPLVFLSARYSSLQRLPVPHEQRKLYLPRHSRGPRWLPQSMLSYQSPVSINLLHLIKTIPYHTTPDRTTPHSTKPNPTYPYLIPINIPRINPEEDFIPLLDEWNTAPHSAASYQTSSHLIIPDRTIPYQLKSNFSKINLPYSGR